MPLKRRKKKSEESSNVAEAKEDKKNGKIEDTILEYYDDFMVGAQEVVQTSGQIVVSNSSRFKEFVYPIKESVFANLDYLYSWGTFKAADPQVASRANIGTPLVAKFREESESSEEFI